MFNQLSTSLLNFLWWAVGVLQTHGEKLFGLAGFSFGVWRWWYYRESVLHKRLQDYLAEQDRRLRDARSYVLEAILRPGPKREFADPLFAVNPLRRVLRTRRWNSIIGIGKVEAQADRNLNRALLDIERRLGIAVSALTSLRGQLASAYLLKGAIACVCASVARDPSKRTELDDQALIQFRTALQVHDYERDVQAKEYEAHQLRKLGHLTEADNAYEQLETFTAWIPDDRSRSLTLARARRHRAQIAQAQTAGGSDDARALIVESIRLRSQFGPYRDWEGIEQGEIHYVEAYIRRRLGHARIEREQLGLAASAYGRILSQTPRSRWPMARYTKRLHATAQAGLQRVERAQENADYDTRWLLPSSHQPQSPSSGVGHTGGN